MAKNKDKKQNKEAIGMEICEKCGKPNSIWRESDIKLTPCECKKDVLRSRFLGKFSHIRLSSLKPINKRQGAILQAIRGNPEASRYFYGTWRTGKTTFMAAVFNCILDKTLSAVWFDAPELTEYLRWAEVKGAGANAWVRGLLIKYDYIFIDDLDTEKIKPTDFNRSALYALFNGIEKWDKSLYITSNYSIGELGAAFGGSIAGRIEEKCNLVRF